MKAQQRELDVVVEVTKVKLATHHLLLKESEDE
jgi:hypothetical protein